MMKNEYVTIDVEKMSIMIRRVHDGKD